MNKLFNNQYQQSMERAMMGFNSPVLSKKGLPFTSESLYGMALYDFDSVAADVGLQSPLTSFRPTIQAPPPVFHPVDEYKDLSLREILDLSDDFLSNDDDHFNSADMAMEPVPFANKSSIQVARNASSHDPMMGQQRQQQQLQQIMMMVQQQQQQPQQQHLDIVSSTPDSLNKKKRSRDFDDASVSSDGSSDDNDRRFRPYQAGQWAEKFEELCEYRDKFGHCLVPHTYHENLALARWVKRQRYQYKLMMEGKSSTMTQDRVKALEDIGFVWDSQGAAWGERLGELHEFRKTYMHCNVPSNFSENPRLATWIKCQRRQYKLFMEGKPSNMTPQRIQHLENLGFEWELRSYAKKARTC